MQVSCLSYMSVEIVYCYLKVWKKDDIQRLYTADTLMNAGFTGGYMSAEILMSCE